MAVVVSGEFAIRPRGTALYQRRTTRRSVPRALDLTGTALNTLGFGLFVIGVGTLGSSDARIGIGEIVAGLFCFGLFIRQQQKHPMPMLPFDLYRIPAFSLSVWTSVCSYAAQILTYVSLPFLLETRMHLSAVETGLLLTSWPFMTAVTAPIAGRLTSRFPTSLICSIGLTLLAAGLLLMVFLPTNPAKLDIAWRLALCGIGFGLFQTPNNTAMMTAGPIGRSGAASGMNAAARYVGWSLGSALISLIFGVGGDHSAIFCLVAGMTFALMGAATSSVRSLR
ncbi:MFS transporter [Bradyrhizobium sp. CCBAU 51627]|uniref:MFS transporter n=1 Tax=Bradyrhizobium sp. CCBAU 51627 TaxID=1325088 RepID=UPI00230627A0|nr:MFS transporter [Bradyrhizobium sp. CCBAU 51627]